MADENASDRARAVFRAHLAKHQTGAEAVGWGSAASQQRRFEVLSEIGDLSQASVLDFGCGLGAMAGWLRGTGFKGRYLGVDFTPEYVDRASNAYPLETFVEGSYDTLSDILADRNFEPDYVFASGVFYLDAEGGHDLMMNHVRTLFEVAGMGLAFNSLSAARSERDDGELYADPGRVMNDCLSLTSKVVLRHDYHPGDFTCYLLKVQA